MRVYNVDNDNVADFFHTEPDYVGSFTRETADGAWPNGSRVVKIMSERGDTHHIGEKATVLGSIGNPALPALGIMYFVEWDNSPGIAVACIARKLEKVKLS